MGGRIRVGDDDECHGRTLTGQSRVPAGAHVGHRRVLHRALARGASERLRGVRTQQAALVSLAGQSTEVEVELVPLVTEV